MSKLNWRLMARGTDPNTGAETWTFVASFETRASAEAYAAKARMICGLEPDHFRVEEDANG